jgi:hypothetical protein
MKTIPEVRLGFKDEPTCCDCKDRCCGMTVAGSYVYDLHDHKGLLRGKMPTPSGEQTRFWYPNGRLHANTDSNMDLAE